MPCVIGIGEVLWDRFPDGDRLGGACANFAFHAGQLGASAYLVSSLGQDADGDRLEVTLRERGLSTEFLQRDPRHPTGLVQVTLDDGQPSYVIESTAAWDHVELTPHLRALAFRADAVCFGTLAQREPGSRRTIQEFVQLCPPATLRVFDINLRQDFFTPETIAFGLDHCRALKLNAGELVHLAEMFGWPTNAREAVAEIFRRHPVETIALTLGAEGCEIYTREHRVKSEAPRVSCVDAVGAGDAFSAALVIGLLAQRPLETVADEANRIGAYVASQAGGMPSLPQGVGR